MSQPHSSQPPDEVAAQFVIFNDHLRASQSREHALERLVQYAVESIPGCDWAAVTEWETHRAPRSLAASHAIAREVDELQYRLGDGPSLSAASEARVIEIDDIEAESGWPRFRAKTVSQTPVRSVLALPLTSEPYRSALNLYSRRAGAFAGGSVTSAALFAAHARVLLTHAVSVEKVAHLELALSTSRQIGTAMGILMQVYKVTSEQAFDMLRVTSQHLHRKLHEIAFDVTQTGSLPDPT